MFVLGLLELVPFRPGFPNVDSHEHSESTGKEVATFRRDALVDNGIPVLGGFVATRLFGDDAVPVGMSLEAGEAQHGLLELVPQESWPHGHCVAPTEAVWLLRAKVGPDVGVGSVVASN